MRPERFWVQPFPDFIPKKSNFFSVLDEKKGVNGLAIVIDGVLVNQKEFRQKILAQSSLPEPNKIGFSFRLNCEQIERKKKRIATSERLTSLWLQDRFGQASVLLTFAPGFAGKVGLAKKKEKEKRNVSASLNQRDGIDHA